MSDHSLLLITGNPSPWATLSPSSASALKKCFSCLSAISFLTPVIAATKLPIVFFLIWSHITFLNRVPGCAKSQLGCWGLNLWTRPVTTYGLYLASSLKAKVFLPVLWEFGS